MSKLVSFFQQPSESPVPVTAEPPPLTPDPPSPEVSPKPDPVPPRKVFGKRKQVDPELGNKLSDLADKNSGELVASRFQMVGLKKILERLADVSDDTAEKAFSIAEKTLQAHLTDEDVYEPHDFSFLVCFAGLDSVQAAQKAKQIETEIQEKILSEGLDAEYSDISTETRTVKVSGDELSQSDDLLNLIAEKIIRETDRVKKGLKIWSSKYLAICEIDPAPVVSKSQRGAGFRLARFSKRTLTDIGQLLKIGAGPIEVAAEADCMMVRRASEIVFQGDRDKDPLMVVDVHYSTLSDQSHRDKFMAACRPITEICANSMMARIIYSSEKPPNLRFSGLVSKLNSLFQSRIMQIKTPRLGSVDLQACKIPVISMNFREIEPVMARYQQELQKFIENVHANRSRLMVDEVSDEETGGRLFELGVDFVSLRT